MTTIKNKRLKLEAERLIQDGKYFYKKVSLDRYWNTNTFGIALQVEVNSHIKKIITQIQNELNKIEPDSLFFPNVGNHISINQVVSWNGKYHLGKEKTWEEINKNSDFVNKFNSLNLKFSPIPINFVKVILTPGAVILFADDLEDRVQEFRKVLDEELPFPAETKKSNCIIHSTIARYRSQLQNPDKILEYTLNQYYNIDMIIDEVKLKEEVVFPSLKTKDLASIHLV